MNDNVQMIEAFLIENLGDGIVVLDEEGEKYICDLDLKINENEFILFDRETDCKIEKNNILKTVENGFYSLTIFLNDGKIMLEQF